MNGENLVISEELIKDIELFVSQMQFIGPQSPFDDIHKRARDVRRAIFAEFSFTRLGENVRNVDNWKLR